MCGFVGILQKKPKAIDAHVLANMLSTIHHRGPDDEGYLIEDSVGFGHKRLSIIDTQCGHQPMHAAHASIVFNGEIYNYIELRDELVKLGHCFRTKSDTEVILRMYLQYGEECVARLNGMFSFLILDRYQRRVLAVRDHLGVKPLYFHARPDTLLFASEIKALQQFPGLRIEPD